MRSETDTEAVQAALQPVADSAKDLPWSEERPWRVDSHVHEENGVVVIDLHDLNARLSKTVLASVTELAPEFHGGGVIFITGRGRHSVGLPVLRRIVLGTLVRLEREKGWRQRDLGAGRILLVVDEERIPSRYRGHMPLWIPAFFVVFACALVWALPLKVGLPLLMLVSWFAVGVWRAGRHRPKGITWEE